MELWPLQGSYLTGLLPFHRFDNYIPSLDGVLTVALGLYLTSLLAQFLFQLLVSGLWWLRSRFWPSIVRLRYAGWLWILLIPGVDSTSVPVTA